MPICGFIWEAEMGGLLTGLAELLLVWYGFYPSILFIIDFINEQTNIYPPVLKDI